MPSLPSELRRTPPAEFVAARDALARRLRAEGDRERAAEVRRLRRPSVALWALNGLADVAPDRVAEVVRAGQGLRTSTQAALLGHDAALGRMSGEHGRLVEELTDRALDVLATLPAPAGRELRARIWTMLRVASLDPALAPGLSAGTLDEEPVSVGFESLQGFEVNTPSAAPAASDVAAPPDEGRAEARRRLERGDQVREATAQAEFARAEAESVRRRLAEVRERAGELRAQLEATERDASRLDRELAAAEEAVVRAEAAVERLRS